MHMRFIERMEQAQQTANKVAKAGLQIFFGCAVLLLLFFILIA